MNNLLLLIKGPPGNQLAFDLFICHPCQHSAWPYDRQQMPDLQDPVVNLPSLQSLELRHTDSDEADTALSRPSMSVLVDPSVQEVAGCIRQRPSKLPVGSALHDSPCGGVTLNRAAGTSHLPGAPSFTRTMFDVMYWMPTLRVDTSGPNCGSVDAALLRLPVCAEPVWSRIYSRLSMHRRK